MSKIPYLKYPLKITFKELLLHQKVFSKEDKKTHSGKIPIDPPFY